MLLTYLKYILGASSLRKVVLHYKLLKQFKKKRAIIGFNTLVRNSDLGFDVFIGENCQITSSKVGDNTYFNANTKVSYANIGKFCSIGSNVNIGIGSHPINMVSTHPCFYANNKGFRTFADKMYYQEENGTIQIGNDVWIGSDATILNNVTIGNGAVIAMGSIVTKDVPDYAIVGGVPAKIIKYRFIQKDIDFLNEVKWWDFSNNELEGNFHSFHSIESLKKYLSRNEE